MIIYTTDTVSRHKDYPNECQEWCKYSDVDKLEKENAALVKRWADLERWLLKDSWAEAISPAVWAKMKVLEGGEG